MNSQRIPNLNNRMQTPWLGEAVSLRVTGRTWACVDIGSKNFAGYVHMGGEP